MAKRHIAMPLVAALFAFAANAQTAWSIGGNNGTSPGGNAVGAAVDGHFIGTTDNSGLVLGTSNTKRAVLDVSGNLFGGAGTLMMNGTTNSFAWGSGNTLGLASPAHYSASFGLQNSTDAAYSFVVGYNNRIMGAGSFSSAAVGQQNTVNASSAFAANQQNTIGPGAAAGAAFGWANSVNGQLGFGAGQQNTLGPNAQAGAVFGYGNNNNGFLSFAAGEANQVGNSGTSPRGTASFGYSNYNYANYGFSAGQQNTLASTAISGTVFGNFNNVTGNTATAFGQGNTSAGTFGFVAGNGNTVGGTDGSAFGGGNTNNGPASIATGSNNTIGAAASNAATFGYQNTVNAADGIAGGQFNNVNAGAQNAVAFGYNNNLSAQQAFANGQYNYVGASAVNSATFGYANSNGGGNTDGSQPNFIMGSYCTVTGKNSIAIGRGNGVGNDNSMAIGTGAGTNADNQFSANFSGGYYLMGGNVGIGTTAPTARLEVNSNVPGQSGLRLTGLAGGGNIQPIGVDGNGNVVAATGGNTIAANNYLPSYENPVSAAAMASSFNMGSAGGTIDYLTPPGDGSAGIGLIKAPYITSPVIWMYSNGNSADNNSFTVASRGYSNDQAERVTNAGNTLLPLFQVRANGKVLIGKTSSNAGTNYLLDVAGDGGIRANRVTVNTTGADFVFDSSYRLQPLAEVESYVRQNQHLPGIAPAAEMQEKGLEVGEGQTRLLQKIEELTLYAIAQDRKQEAQQKLIAEQARLLKSQQDMLLDMKKQLEEIKNKENQQK